MLSDSELPILCFDLKKESVALCSSIVQNPTGQNLIGESDGPIRQLLGDSDHRILGYNIELCFFMYTRIYEKISKSQT